MATNGEKSRSRQISENILNFKVKDVRNKVKKWDEIRLDYYKRSNLEERVKIYLIYQEPKDKNSIPETLYVGKTKQALEKRLGQHMSEINAALAGKKNWTIKSRWMYQVMQKSNLKIVLVNLVQKSKAYVIEQEWITYLGLHGFNMMNQNNDKYIYKKVFKI